MKSFLSFASLKRRPFAVEFSRVPLRVAAACGLCWAAARAQAPAAADAPPPPPRFSMGDMDRSVEPGQDFYRFADGNWVKHNPVPPDKSRWASFSEVAERNWSLIHQILEEARAAGDAPAHSPKGEVGAFFASAMDTNRIEALGFQPIAGDLKRIDQARSRKDLLALLADFHRRDIAGIFDVGFGPDAKHSAIYALHLRQGGLSLPDRDYYLKSSFAGIRDQYRAHVARMFALLGEKPDQAAADAAVALDLETALAKASRSRVALRDPDKNYNRFAFAQFQNKTPAIDWSAYFRAAGVATAPEQGDAANSPEPGRRASRQPDNSLARASYEIVGQPEFFEAANALVRDRPVADWKIYLRWHLLHESAPFLQRAIEEENFAFFGKVLSGQERQEPRWKRAAHVIDAAIGEALGQLYVEKYFPPEAKARMNELVENLKAVFRDHLKTVSWMTEPTRAKALAKFEQFTQKIGFPDKFRDYSKVALRRDDYLGNVRRAAAFEFHRELIRIGKPVDKTEWHMTPETVNAYFNPLQNEIVFPAGILQPPFFDGTMDDAVNYGGIGAVIGHEITHGYDDQGRKYDAQGNLHDWWTPEDAKAFEARAQKVVAEYDAFQPLPGAHVNGRLTLGENIADLGGVTIAYDALERALAKHPSERKKIDGFTPEQRFFISFAQIWRTNIRDAEARRLVTVDPHSPGRFRAVGPLVNLQSFYDAFGIGPSDPMWRSPEERAKIW